MMDGKSTLNSFILVEEQNTIYLVLGVEQRVLGNDQLTSIDVAYMNPREIIALNNKSNNDMVEVVRQTL
jgi:hypothetical protein